MIAEKAFKLIKKYAQTMNVNYAFVMNAFNKGDIWQKKRDLVAMRCTLYLKKHGKTGMTIEEQDRLVKQFMKKEKHLNSIKWPEIKVKQKATVLDPQDVAIPLNEKAN